MDEFARRPAEDRRAFGRQVDADLMGAAGVQGAGDASRQPSVRGLGRAAEGLLDHIVGDRLASAGAQHGHLLAVAAGTADLGLDAAFLGRGRAARQGHIGALDVVGGEQGGEPCVGAVGLGGDHDARGVLVEAVDDAGAGHAADAGETVAAMRQ